jgi:tetrahydromethanopterin S-methyltransferase subunit G
MTSDITELRYWLDIIIKAAIGVLVSIIGLDYRAVKNSLHELETHKYTVTAEVQVIQTELAYIKGRLDKIDAKLDKALDR